MRGIAGIYRQCSCLRKAPLQQWHQQQNSFAYCVFPPHGHVYTIALFNVFVVLDRISTTWWEGCNNYIFQFLLLSMYSADFIVSLNINELNILKRNLVSGKSMLLLFSQNTQFETIGEAVTVWERGRPAYKRLAQAEASTTVQHCARNTCTANHALCLIWGELVCVCVVVVVLRFYPILQPIMKFPVEVQ